MKSKLRGRFQWGGGKNKGAFPTSKSEAKYVDVDTPTDTSTVNITPNNVDTLKLQDYPEIHTPNEGNVTVSTLSNEGAFSQKRFNCGFDSDERSTMREQMWYKNQVYLKQKRVGVSLADVASSYASDKRWSQYDDDEGSDAADAPDSPVGVTELDSFYQRFPRRSDSETHAHRSCALVNATEATSVYDDDGTKSTFFYSESETEDGTNTNFEDVTLGTTDTSTRYEMAPGEKSKKYKLGFGTTSSSQRSSMGYSKREESRSPPRRRRCPNKSYSNYDDSDTIDSRCPLLVSDELRGTIQDASQAISQVLHAFFISPDDVDKTSDKIRDAGYDFRELQETYRYKSCLPSRR